MAGPAENALSFEKEAEEEALLLFPPLMMISREL